MSTTTRVTTEQFHEMIRQGVFEPREENDAELIDGEILPMGAAGPPRAWYMSELIDWSYRVLGTGAVSVGIQDPIEISVLDSEPRPDFVWAKRLNYLRRLPTPDDVLHLVEIADSSLAKDQGVKAGLYARAKIADYWIVNIADQCIEVRLDPAGEVFQSLSVFKSAQEVRPPAFPDFVLPVSILFEG